MNESYWKLTVRQVRAVARFELLRYLAGRRWIGVYLLAFAPVAIFCLFSYFARSATPPGAMDEVYGTYFQSFVLRFAIFVSCGAMFSQLFRGETLEKTLHLYLLTPVPRPVLAAGKYVAALVASTTLFCVSTVATYLLFYVPGNGAFLEHPGLMPLARYLAATVLACTVYGAVFLLVGMLFKNPGVPGLFLMGWEAYSSMLPSMLQGFSVSYYLQPLLPFKIDRGPFVVVTEPASLFVGVPGLLIFSLVLVAVSGWFAGRLEVTYGAE